MDASENEDSNIKELSNKMKFDEFTKEPGLKLVHFFAPWAAACKEMEKLLIEFENEFPKTFKVAKVHAEEVPEASIENSVTSVPTIVFFKDGICIDKRDGFSPLEIKNLIVKHSSTVKPYTDSETNKQEKGNDEKNEKESKDERLKRLITKSRMTLFMKGSADAPKCGFSKQIVGLLKQHGVDFWTFDILSDEQVRQDLKVYSDWPTYPQLYLDGEFLGGLDVVSEEFKDPAFVARLPKLNH